jgi:tetratricopeptide (TPR) repeat protein
MGAPYERARRLFFEVRRADLAEQELRHELAESPANALAHALMSLVANRRGRRDEGLKWARESIRLDPGLAYAHYALAYILNALGRYPEAASAIAEALRLEPTNAHHHFYSAVIEDNRRRHRDSLAAAERGLALDATHTGCLSMRALALAKLRRHAEAEEVIASALGLDPNNDYTHAAAGHRALARGDRRLARVHFRQALRINPENAWAEHGLTTVGVPFPRWGWLLLLPLLPLMAAMVRLQQPDFRTSPAARGAVPILAFACLAVIAVFGVTVESYQRRARARLHEDP